MFYFRPDRRAAGSVCRSKFNHFVRTGRYTSSERMLKRKPEAFARQLAKFKPRAIQAGRRKWRWPCDNVNFVPFLKDAHSNPAPCSHPHGQGWHIIHRQIRATTVGNWYLKNCISWVKSCHHDVKLGEGFIIIPPRWAYRGVYSIVACVATPGDRWVRTSHLCSDPLLRLAQIRWKVYI